MTRKPDDLFFADLRNSAGAVEAVQRRLEKRARLQEKNLSFVAPELVIRPLDADPRDYQDGGDILVLRDGREIGVIEVKGRGLQFKGLNDYPYWTVIIDEVQKVNRDRRGPLIGYVLVNMARNRGLYIAAKDIEDYGFEHTRFDSRAGGDVRNIEVRKYQSRAGRFVFWQWAL